MEKASRKYLERYSEKEIALTRFIEDNYEHVLVIPCYAEASGILATLRSVPCPEQSLVILVLNARRNSSADILRSNQQSFQCLKQHSESQTETNTSPPATLFRMQGLSVLVVDRSGDGYRFNPDQGVGLARKIGCDIALKLILDGQVSVPWIHSTDADATLPPDYFARIPNTNECSALLYPFQHEGELALRYEMSLRYYVLGLAHSGSPYAYHSIGSTIAVSARHYPQVRGFPRRQAGEDYYLLNKLAKVAPIRRLRGKPIRLSGRTSSRVPFGTGPALSAMADRELLYYDPKIFCRLGKFLSMHCKSEADHVNFDAFQTLKWIHRERDRRCPSLPWRKAFEQAEFLDASPGKLVDSPAALCEWLGQLENKASSTIGVRGEAC